MESEADWNGFDVGEYVQRCYGERILEVDREIILGVIDELTGRLGVRPQSWRRVADVGAGPNLFPGLLLTPFMAPRADGGRLELLDISRPNLEYLRAALDPAGESPYPGDLLEVWGKFETLMAGRSPLWRGSLSTLREVAEVHARDIRALPPNTYDAVTSFFATESITSSRDECALAIDKLIGAARPGGVVVVAHMLSSQTWYTGRTHFPAVPITLEDLHEWYDDRLDDVAFIAPPPTQELRDDFHGSAVVVGRKKPEKLVAERLSTPYDIQDCLYDERRVEYFERALAETVRPGDVVVDAGSGTGILGLLAAKAGAVKVYCLEISSEYAEVIRRNADENGFGDRIEVRHADATVCGLPEPVDVIVCESVSGGLFYEPQLQILANLRRFLKPGGVVVPAAMENQLELIEAQEELYGLRFRHDTRHRILPGDRALTGRATYLPVDFAQDSPLMVDATVRVHGERAGRANAVRVPYQVRFAAGVSAGEATEFLLNPQTIFLPESLDIVPGAEYLVSIRYRCGSSPLTARVEVAPVPT